MAAGVRAGRWRDAGVSRRRARRFGAEAGVLDAWARRAGGPWRGDLDAARVLSRTGARSTVRNGILAERGRADGGRRADLDALPLASVAGPPWARGGHDRAGCLWRGALAV